MLPSSFIFHSLLGEGLEPSRPKAPEPKSGVSANFTTRAEIEKYVCDSREGVCQL